MLASLMASTMGLSIDGSKGRLWIAGTEGKKRQEPFSDAYLTQIFIVPLIMSSLYSKQIYKLTSGFKHQHIFVLCTNYDVLVTFSTKHSNFAFLSTCFSSFLVNNVHWLFTSASTIRALFRTLRSNTTKKL